LAAAMSSARLLTAPFRRGGISKWGDEEGLVSEGVSKEVVVLELERECGCVLGLFPVKDLLV
jgi:hypothetical protein